MSRIGRKPISIPEGVEIGVNGTDVTVSGPKGSLNRAFHKDMIITREGNEVLVTRPSDNKLHRSLHGTTRSIISNMIDGVSKGFEKRLDLVGVGYRANKDGKSVRLSIGFSHPVEIHPVDGIEFEVPDNTKIIVKGINKELVGEIAAKIRSIREPEPYKGKGIKYSNEVIRRKEGKTGKGKSGKK